MYLKHFGLREPPFSLTPDTSFCYNLSPHQEAFNVLVVALRGGEGFVKISGEVGTGKTLLCRKLLDSLPKQYVSVYLPNPLLTPRQLHQAVADELGLELPRDASLQELLKHISRELIALSGSYRSVVLCIDEVQTMPEQSLEALRLLSNLETEKRKLVQIILFGQPELDQRLQKPGLRQLRQRITSSYQLRSMDRQEMEGYIAHRLLVGGCQGGILFRPAAIKAIHRGSKGIPRLVNILCHKSMLAAFGRGDRLVDRHHVLAAIQDTEDARTNFKLRLSPWGLFGRMLHPVWVALFCSWLPWGGQ